jgi:hypothetical protein
MSTIQGTKRKTSRFRWTTEQFQKAAEDGWFGDRKVELPPRRYGNLLVIRRVSVVSVSRAS